MGKVTGLLIKFEGTLGFSSGVRAQTEITQMDHVCYRPHTSVSFLKLS